MGILDKAGRQVQPQKTVTPSYVQNVSSDILERAKQLELSKEEFEFLFGIIKNASFKGSELEIIYSILSKLQTRYLSIDKIN